MSSLFLASSQPKTTPSKDYFVATDDHTSVFVRRSDAARYQDLVTLLVVFFPSLNSQSVVVQTNELDICVGRYVDIPADLWPEISPQIQNIRVVPRPIQDLATTPPPSYGGCLPRGRGMRKPVIYLFSPRPVRSIVRVSLVNAWSFSAVYPSVPIKDSELGQSIAWDVNTHKDHSLTTTTGTRVSYLFWEAEPNRGASPPSPPPSPRNTVVPFDPLFPQVNNENSVVLRASQAAEYLDKALSALCLHVEARTSFITYWLPSILKYNYVALHFLPQASYEHAAPLDVEPKPDIVTRVFMLFTKVCEDELVEWEGALTRAFENVDIWKGIVGVDGHKATDERLFRVLEWGGMEVAR